MSPVTHWQMWHCFVDSTFHEKTSIRTFWIRFIHNLKMSCDTLTNAPLLSFAQFPPKQLFSFGIVSQTQEVKFCGWVESLRSRESNNIHVKQYIHMILEYTHDMTSFEKMSWFEHWKHAFLKVIRVSCKVLYQHCMLLRYVGIVFWMQKNQRSVQTANFTVFTTCGRELPVEKTYLWWKLKKRKRIFLTVFHQYDLNRVYHEIADVLRIPKML